ncbi:hypothetical protein ACI8BE_002330 [Proteus mirabilis]|uniref:hypothetical protein n=1 Tax=Morganellaceae TaxID=1903414 RepID=UPI001EFE9115|nr:MULTISPECIES: hypothetical protein [Morganellaceae]MCG9537141.1 hypothetical protein [Providencia huaxiensis]
MEGQIEITTNLCHENVCNNVILQLSKSEVIKIQNSVISNNPPLGNINENILGAGLGLVLIFYLLGYGLGRMIKMVNL